MLAAVAVALLCGAAVFLAVHAHLASVAGAEAARLSQVTAVILEPAAPGRSRAAIGQWPAGDGTLRAGVIHAPGKGAGDPHPVWIDRRGELSDPPASAAQRAAQAAAAGAAVSAAVLAVIRRRQPDDVDVEWRRVSRDWRRRYR